MHSSIKRCIFFIFLFTSLHYNARASHSSGQDLTYSYLGDSAGLQHYLVTLTLYEDCIAGDPGAIAQDNPAFLGLFDAATGSLLGMDTSIYYTSSTSMPITVTGPCDSGGTILPMCSLQKVFTKDYYLAPSANGYVISYQRCCLNGSLVNIVNPGSNGLTAFCRIPPSGVAATNNSSLFTNYPPYVIANNFPLTFDCSATDADDDSLSYELCNTYNGADDPLNSKPFPVGPPYSMQGYIAPLSYDNPVLCSVPMSLDAVTGQLTGTPNSLGRYLMEVCCNEWRGGVLINTTHREFEFLVATCPWSDSAVAREAVQQIAPNPASTTFTLATTCRIESLAIFDTYGNRYNNVPWNFQQALGGKTSDRNVLIDVSLLPNGLYFVKINNNIVQKFLKEQQQ
jgi:hypothetical protein